ncbi:hypothetical protein [Nostoc sp. NMS4]|uniref:hypothetical protein n=1 Tax=Nostoc sp. NMS4 TaxID=2815390 RepID=UPI0025CBA4D3|nr:hypothetical protein [Nostoc sp. NMS4]MBN3924779.1 hypothetical protein [Nostoc sp. NMS4]
MEKELVKTTYDSSVLSPQYRQDIVKQSSIPFQEQIPNTVKNTKAESSNKLLSIIGVIVLGIIGILLLIGFSNGIAHGFGIGLLLGSCKKASDLIKNKMPSK